MFPAMTDTSIHPAFACGHAFAWALIAVWVVVSQIQQDPHRSTARGWHCLWSRIAVGIAAVVAQDLQLRITTLEGRVCAMCGNGTFVESILDLVWEWGKAHAEGRIYWDSGRNMMNYSYVPSSQILLIGYVLIKELPSISTRKLFYPLLVVYKWVYKCMQVFTNFPFVLQASCRVGVACVAFVVVARVPGLQREFASRPSPANIRTRLSGSLTSTGLPAEAQSSYGIQVLRAWNENNEMPDEWVLLNCSFGTLPESLIGIGHLDICLDHIVGLWEFLLSSCIIGIPRRVKTFDAAPPSASYTLMDCFTVALYQYLNLR